MSIADLELFKKERLEAILTDDILLLRAWAAKYGVKLPKDDLEAMRGAKSMPVWD